MPGLTIQHFPSRAASHLACEELVPLAQSSSRPSTATAALLQPLCTDVKRLQSTDPGPQILILEGLIVEMSCTSVQNERRAFCFQHRLCSSEPGSKPSFSLPVSPLHFSEPSSPAVSPPSTARQVQLGTLPGPITSTAHSLLLQAMICSGSSYFSCFSLPRRTTDPPTSSPRLWSWMLHVCVSAFESRRKRRHGEEGCLPARVRDSHFNPPCQQQKKGVILIVVLE